ncbi:MAG: glutathione S-transferase N-terminal domain-containing protein [Hydrogenophilales bacterium]|nr:glutathione S-transferase N-terminal domain-containing protein [Hydrogenophilales bacterium]
MKWLFRTFFKTLRVILGPILLLQEKLTAPAGLVRSAEAQQAVDQQLRSLALYQFKTCPFCIKVRQEMRRLSLNIELRDAQNDASHREALLQEGGRTAVPCLRIVDADGTSRWMYESGDIIEYLRGRFVA